MPNINNNKLLRRSEVAILAKKVKNTYSKYEKRLKVRVKINRI